MQAQSSLRAAWLTARIFLPSKASLSICIMIGVAATCLHLLVIGFDQGAILPNFLDGQWAAAYNSAIRDPLDAFLSRTTLNSVLEVVIWGIIGLTVYSLAERFFRNYFEWRDAERSVQLIGPGRVVSHPLQRPFYSILIWRVTNAILLMIWLVITLAMFRQLLQVNGLAFVGSDSDQFNGYLLSLAVQWTLVAHSLVVLLRLMVRRARLFGHPSHTGPGDDFFQD